MGRVAGVFLVVLVVDVAWLVAVGGEGGRERSYPFFGRNYLIILLG